MDPNEIQIFEELKKLFEDTKTCDKQLEEAVYKLHEAYDAERNAAYDKRQEIIEQFEARAAQLVEGGSDPPFLNNFWSKAMRYGCKDFDNDDNEAILFFLKDVRHKLMNSDDFTKTHILLEFHFAKNPFFENEFLTKRYYLNEEPQKDPGAIPQQKIVGCDINWHDGEQNKISTPFLNFFSSCDCTIPSRSLLHDLKLGFFIKEEVIPAAIYYFLEQRSPMGSISHESDSEDSLSTTSESGTLPDSDIYLGTSSDIDSYDESEDVVYADSSTEEES